ncbi:hypothetical protein [Streptomyces sp. NPDC055287]
MPSPAAGGQAGPPDRGAPLAPRASHPGASGGRSSAAGPSLAPTAPVAGPSPAPPAPAAGDAPGYSGAPRRAAGPDGVGSRSGDRVRQAGPGAPGGGGVAPVETTARLRPVPAAPGALPPQVPSPPAAPPATPPPGATGAPRRRAVGAVDLGPQPGPPRPAHFAAPRQWGAPETPAETTTRLRPVRTRRTGRVVAAATCLVLGLGLIGGAVTGSWLTGGADAGTAAPTGYAEARGLWHSAPVDALFPPTIEGDGAGPGGADRVWTRVAVAPDDGDCAKAVDPLLLKALEPVGCLRLLRATYTDATTSSVTTVGMVFTEADAPAMKALRTRFINEGLADRTDLMPRTYPAEGTVAASFGDRQRASWTVRVLTDVPVVVYAVSGFADGRTVADPQPAGRATVAGATNAPAQAGLGHEAKGVADRVERGLRKTAHPATEPTR